MRCFAQYMLRVLQHPQVTRTSQPYYWGNSATLLRFTVYFRDGYRATSYGIPDLVEIIRKIDRELDQKEEEDKKGQGNKRKNWVKLSFIGHSMGGYVVTSVVRILSDVFSPQSVPPKLHVKDAGPTDTPNEEYEDPRPQPYIGNVFRLTRLILVSPESLPRR
jgi:hypothetical protein